MKTYTMKTNGVNLDTTSLGVIAPNRILQSVLAALNKGEISNAVDQFDDHFTFTDHALDLAFTHKERLGQILSTITGAVP